MGGLLKETPSTQLFTVFGMPRTEIQETDNGEYIVKMEGVDVYNPVDNTVNSAGADKVTAWFVDADYDGRTFCITQAFFPDKKAWDKIARALKGVIDEEQFEKFSSKDIPGITDNAYPELCFCLYLYCCCFLHGSIHWVEFRKHSHKRISCLSSAVRFTYYKYWRNHCYEK